MDKPIKHLLLTNVERNVVLTDCEVLVNRISVGCLYADNCTTSELVVTSGLGQKYKIKLPGEYLNVLSGIQFNLNILRLE